MSTIEAPRAAAPIDTRQALLNSLNFEIPQREISGGYRLGMSLLAAALVLISFAFVGLVFFLAWLGFWHLYNAFASLEAGPYFLFHVPMALLGLMLVVFLIKPIFFRSREGEEEAITLTREEQPLLFDYVERLCEAANAPMPHAIEVDCVPNAHARFTGFMGLFRRRMVLRIGLPLVAALRVNQLTGIMAHEIGHFSQRSGMVASYLIRLLTAFLARVVFQRDRLDMLLEQLRANRNGFGVVLYWIAIVFIEPARGVLWVMLLAGESLSAHFLRHMELDADCLEAQVHGSVEFEKVSHTLVFLSVAHERTRMQMAESWEQRRLADDFTRLTIGEAQYLSKNHRDIIDILEKQTTRWFDSHPCHADRVLNVREANLEPLVKTDVSATALFRDFQGLSKRATQSMYKAILKQDLAKAAFIPAEQMAVEFSRQRRRFKALDDFFCGQHGVEGPIFPLPEASAPPLNVPETIASLNHARDELMQCAPGMPELVEALQEASLHVAVTSGQRELAALFPDNPQAQRLMGRATRNYRKHTEDREKLREKTSHFAEVGEHRITRALQLAAHPAIGQRMKHSTTIRKVLDKYFPMSDALRTLHPDIQKIADESICLRVFCSAYSPEQPYRPLHDRIISEADSLLKRATHIKSQLDRFIYPFEHATAGITVGKSLNEEPVPPTDDVPAVLNYIITLIDRYYAFAFRVLSQLTTVAAAAEAAVDLKPLEPPKPDEKAANKKRDRSGIAFWLTYSFRAVAGLFLLTMLIWWSFDPPALPAMSWGNKDSGRYRPASFTTSVEHFNRYDPRAYQAPPANNSNYSIPRGAPEFTPRNGPSNRRAIPGIALPNMPDPMNPGRMQRPGMPNYNQPQSIIEQQAFGPGPNRPQPPNPVGRGPRYPDGITVPDPMEGLRPQQPQIPGQPVRPGQPGYPAQPTIPRPGYPNIPTPPTPGAGRSPYPTTPTIPQPGMPRGTRGGRGSPAE